MRIHPDDVRHVQAWLAARGASASLHAQMDMQMDMMMRMRGLPRCRHAMLPAD